MNEEEKSNTADDGATTAATTTAVVVEAAAEAATEVVAAVKEVLPPPPLSSAEGSGPPPPSSPTPTSTPTPTTTTTTPARRESHRARKSTSSTYVPEESFATKKEVLIPHGSGIKLSEMPTVVDNFKSVTWSDPILKKLYGIVFGVGKKKEFKSHLFQFNGLVYPTPTPAPPTNDKDQDKDKDVVDDTKERNRDLYKLKMYKLKMEELKNVMDLCDIDRSTESFSSNGDGDEKAKQQPDKEMLCIRFMEWLEQPKVNSNEKKSKTGNKKKRKSTSSSTTSSPSTTTPSKKKKTTKKSPTSATKKKVAATSPASSKKKTKKSPASSTKKVAKKGTAAAAATTTATTTSTGIVVEWNIPGVTLDKVRDKVQRIIEGGDKETLTVKSVRTALEEWLDMDLTKHKDTVRSLTMEFL